MGSRKAKKHEHVNHERWLVSYADFITLLFAFFVVMFSTSQVDGKKLQHYEEAIGIAFHFPPVGGRVGSVLVGGGGGNSVVQAVAGNSPSFRRHILPPTPPVDPEERALLVKRLDAQVTAAELADSVRLRESEAGVVLEVPAEAVFPLGAAEIRPGALALLGALQPLLTRQPHSIRIEVHTNDAPIDVTQVGSAWELSALRAAKLARYFDRRGAAAERLSACGFAGAEPPPAAASAGAPVATRRVEFVLVGS